MASPLPIFSLYTLSLLLLTHSLSPEISLLLTKIKPTLEGKTVNPVLSQWNLSLPLCQWPGLKWSFHQTPSSQQQQQDPCLDPSLSSNLSLSLDSSLRLVSLQLPSANLSGSLPGEISQLHSLSLLILSFNSLSGTIPLELGFAQSLSKIDFRNNSLSGFLPISIWNLCGENIVSFNVHSNNLSGSLPEPALPNASCTSLLSLDLGRNLFSGNFPEFVTKFGSLKELDLSGNGFSGKVPESVVGLNLERLNLSFNNFSGVLPNSKFGVEAFEGNSELCGGPLRKCNFRSHGGISSGAIAGLVIGLMTGAVVLASLLIGYTQGRRRKNKLGDDDDEEFEDGEEREEGERDDGKLVLFQGGEHLTLEDVLNASGQVMEKSSYGTVYKAKLADGGTIALRLLREGSCKDKGHCLPVIKQLGRIRHENLIPLRAFYQGTRGEKLLIYDFLANKSLHDLLHESRVGKPPLNWARRHKIALCIAKGLAYLHTGLETPVTHGNIRSKNILVDDFFVARITDFGLDKLMIPVVADELVAQAKSDGYKAPELHNMKKCNSRTDVYAFGILLLEILLGKKPGKNVDLPSMVKVAVLEETTMEVFDVEILKAIRSPMEDGLVQALKLAMGCCAPVAMVRPTMDEVVKQLEENRPRNRSALYSPAETRSGSITPF